MPDTPNSAEAVVQTLTIDGFKPEMEAQSVLRIFDNNQADFFGLWFKTFAETVKDEKQVFVYIPPQLGRAKIHMVDPFTYMQREQQLRDFPHPPDRPMFTFDDVEEVEIAGVHGRFWTASMLAPDRAAVMTLKNLLLK
jgi:hypothetical protein